MLRINKIADYAIVLLLDMANEGWTSVHSTRAIAERTQVAQPTVSKIMKTLQRAGLVTAHRGLCGGYTLAKSPSSIDLLQIIEAIEGPVSITACSRPESIDCVTHETCQVGPHWPVINSAITNLLKRIRLNDLKTGESLGGALLPAPANPDTQEHHHV